MADRPVVFLGPTMQYTCSYFQTPADDLDDSQRRKMDQICRKMRLGPGQRLLDVGCGWGGLLRHAGQNFGVTGVGVFEQLVINEHRPTGLRGFTEGHQPDDQPGRSPA